MSHYYIIISYVSPASSLIKTVGLVTMSSQLSVVKGLKFKLVYSSNSAYHDCSGDLCWP